jgi:hypothetical protein
VSCANNDHTLPYCSGHEVSKITQILVVLIFPTWPRLSILGKERFLVFFTGDDLLIQGAQGEGPERRDVSGLILDWLAVRFLERELVVELFSDRTEADLKLLNSSSLVWMASFLSIYTVDVDFILAILVSEFAAPDRDIFDKVIDIFTLLALSTSESVYGSSEMSKLNMKG